MAADTLSRVFAALADPTRRDMVARLAAGDATVNQLAEPYPMTLQAVYKHLKVLEDAGIAYLSIAEADWNNAPELPMAFRRDSTPYIPRLNRMLPNTRKWRRPGIRNSIRVHSPQSTVHSQRSTAD